MQQARRKPVNSNTESVSGSRHTGEALLIVCSALALYFLLALSTYSASDPGWSSTGITSGVQNWGGRFGAWISDLLFQAFGRVAYLLPVMVLMLGWRIYRGRLTMYPHELSGRLVSALGFVLTIVGGCGLESQHFYGSASGLPFVAGGVLGSIASSSLRGVFGFAGSTVFLLAMFLTGVTLFIKLSWFWLMDRIGEQVFAAIGVVHGRLGQSVDKAVGIKAKRERMVSVKAIRERLDSEGKRPPRIEPKIQARADSGRLERDKQSTLFEAKVTTSSVIPPLTLLDPPGQHDPGFSKDTLQAMSRLVEKKLADFNIDVQVVAVHPGPVITRFEIDPAPGIKASQIQNLSRDLARALSTVSVRVVDNIPGKTVIGLEVPNEAREVVHLVEGLSSTAYEEANTPLALMLGKDISGVPVIADLCRMPHLLVAGTTGSGKSVCLNALIMSIVFKSSPKDVRMIMIDPKMLELSIYDGIPHLLAPVVTEMSEAANALRWCIFEMERRYRVMASLGVRNISGYNRKVAGAEESGQPIPDPLAQDPEAAEPLASLPYVVIIIDELADLMIVVGKKVEELITRLAQKGRAAGIHLILATQRPSVDVITGLIKANIPCRIAFQVSSKVDSRTVLDQIGAEHLLGHGDMLYLPPGTSTPERVHGSFVTDQEVHSVVKHLKHAGEPAYDDEILAGSPRVVEAVTGETTTASGGESPEDDPLYDQALRIVTESRRASVSAVQRQLRVGYNRAARMIEAMEQAGVVGPLQSNGKREVLAPPPPE
ncbi:MAG: DNA translocase FtsK 4TM domain-containing protein [Arenicellales bacterium]